MEKNGPPPGAESFGSPTLSHVQQPEFAVQTPGTIGDEHHHHHRHPIPPPYSGPSFQHDQDEHEEGPSVQIPQQRAFPLYAGLPRLDYRIYQPPLFKMSSDLTTLSSKADYLSTNASALHSLIQSQASVPPKPIIRIRGSRNGGQRRIDFDIKLNLMSLFLSEDEKSQMNFVECVRSGEMAHRGGARPDVKPEIGDGGLEQWCKMYTQDEANIKIFTLDRIIVNIDFNWIEGQIRSLLASLSYKGVVDVELITTHSKVMIQNPDKVNPFFTSITGMFSGKHKYEVVRSVWPFATAAKGRPGRRCATIDEETWWKEWRDPIKFAISQQRQGWVTIEDKLEAVMEGKGATTSVDWGPDFAG